MKVKIVRNGCVHDIFDSNETPILLVLDDEEKRCLSAMGTAKRFCSPPEGADLDVIRKFMGDED